MLLKIIIILLKIKLHNLEYRLFETTFYNNFSSTLIHSKKKPQNPTRSQSCGSAHACKMLDWKNKNVNCRIKEAICLNCFILTKAVCRGELNQHIKPLTTHLLACSKLHPVYSTLDVRFRKTSV